MDEPTIEEPRIAPAAPPFGAELDAALAKLTPPGAILGSSIVGSSMGSSLHLLQ